MNTTFLRSLACALAMSGALGAMAASSDNTILQHVHGLAFTPDGKSLLVPAHIGLAVYRDGRWTTAPGHSHDFMGFSVAKNAIYTSGHPAPTSPLRNPLGLMKSTDGGASWTAVGLAGESDLHQMAAGYQSNAVYVVNSEPNSKMRQTGLHHTTDDGKSWKRSAAAGLTAQIISIAPHPSEPETLAVGTANGLYLSRDFGASFKSTGNSSAVTAALFDLDGKQIFFVSEDAKALHRVTLEGRSNSALPLPQLERDFVLYIAQNPVNAKELAFATRNRHVFLSKDSGRSWKRIARAGEST